MDQRPIGVFDSGLGGLTAVHSLWRILPEEDLIYFGDTARVPYGGRSREAILKYARQDVRFLRSFDLKAILIACGTVTTTSLTALQAENDRIQEYDQVESLIFSHCLHHKMGKLVELYRGELIPSRAFADGGIHEAIEQYEDVVFYEILAEELALRDMNGEPLTRENYGELMDRIDAYLSEFDEHGTDNISVDLP